MISSRSKANFPLGPKNPKLADIRKEMKEEIERERLFGDAAYEVWINEVTPPQGVWDIWDTCMRAVKDCDVLIALYNGDAGWATEAGENGICHDELSQAYSTAPGKVRLIMLPKVPIDNSAAGKRNKRFQEYVDKQHAFAGGEVNTVDELKQRVREALRDAIVTLTQNGVLEAARGRSDLGQALDWNRKNFAQRQAAMIDILHAAISERGDAKQDGKDLFVTIDSKEVLFVLNAVPAAMSVAAAREMVGQPFLRDHLYAPSLSGNRGGPVHLIGCQKTITEAQAIRLLGFPDATVVTTQFGVYVADNVQKIQLVLIANCRDPSNTRYGVQRFFNWLGQTGEGDLLAQRAAARARIVKSIATELPTDARPTP
jgi:hypothetical protein